MTGKLDQSKFAKKRVETRKKISIELIDAQRQEEEEEEGGGDLELAGGKYF